MYSGIQIAYINLYAVAYGDNEVDVNFKINRSEVVSLEKNKGRIQQHLNEPLAVYDKARFGFDRWGFHRPIVIRYDVSHMHESLTTELAIQFTQPDDPTFDATQRMMIVGYSVDAKVGDQRNIRPLTDVLVSEKR